MENNFSSTINKPHSYKHRVLTSFLLFFLFLLGIYFAVGFSDQVPWFGGYLKDNSSQIELDVLKERSEFLFHIPAITREEQMSLGDLPEKVRDLLPGDIKIFWIYVIYFADGSRGYKVEYHTNNKLINEYSGFLDRWYDQGPYESMNSTRGKNAALSMMENKFHRLVAEFREQSRTSTIVKFTILSK